MTRQTQNATSTSSNTPTNNNKLGGRKVVLTFSPDKHSMTAGSELRKEAPVSPTTCFHSIFKIPASTARFSNEERVSQRNKFMRSKSARDLAELFPDESVKDSEVDNSNPFYCHEVIDWSEEDAKQQQLQQPQVQKSSKRVKVTHTSSKSAQTPSLEYKDLSLAEVLEQYSDRKYHRWHPIIKEMHRRQQKYLFPRFYIELRCVEFDEEKQGQSSNAFAEVKEKYTPPLSPRSAAATTLFMLGSSVADGERTADNGKQLISAKKLSYK